MMKVTPHDYQMAMDSQCAPNLSGIVFSFAKIMERICEDTREEGGYAKNTHPICRLFAEQISHLSGGGPCGDWESFHKAYEICEEMAKSGPLEIVYEPDGVPVISLEGLAGLPE